jgi:hypothetical protein
LLPASAQLPGFVALAWATGGQSDVEAKGTSWNICDGLLVPVDIEISHRETVLSLPVLPR